MRIEKELLDSLYKTYGFTIKTDNELVRIYLFEKGRYYGADIVPILNTVLAKKEGESIKHQFSEMGYATQVRNYNTIQDAELELYKSFFSYELVRNRITEKYKRFVSNQSKLNGGSKYD